MDSNNSSSRRGRGGAPSRGGKPSAAVPKSGGWGSQRVDSAPQYKPSQPASSSVSSTSSVRGARGSNRGKSGSRHSNKDSHPQHHGVALPAPEHCLRIIDIGANMIHRQFEHDLHDTLMRSLESKVYPIIVTGTSVRSSSQAQSLCQSYPGLLFSTAGVHPHDAKSCDANTISKLRSIAANPQVVAIGECGLDFDRNFSEPSVQEHWFVEQLKLAGELKKPVFLHERAASKRFVEILEENKNNFDMSRAIVHCFTGNAQELEKYLEMGMSIGITGWITSNTRGKELQQVVKKIPLDKLMIETDCPFLAPHNGTDENGVRVKISRNEPELLHLVLEEVARCMDLTVEEVAAATTANALRFFDIPDQVPDMKKFVKK